MIARPSGPFSSYGGSVSGLKEKGRSSKSRSRIQGTRTNFAAELVVDDFATTATRPPFKQVALMMSDSEPR